MSRPDPTLVQQVRADLLAGSPHPTARVRRDPTARVRRGRYLAPGTVPSEGPAALLTRVVAVDLDARQDKVFSHHSAAAAWGLPVVGRWPELVEHITPAGAKGRSPGVRRRRCERPVRAVEHAGLRLTSVARTVVDLARDLPLEGALAAADHALHHGWCCQADLAAEVDDLPPGARGRRRAQLVLLLADGRAESVGESLSRAALYRLGLPRPVLQHAVPRADGGHDRVDFAWPAVRVVGEFDGLLKYGSLEGQGPEAARAALVAEKVREDRLRSAGLTVVRWTWQDARSPQRLHRLLTAAGVRGSAGALDWPVPPACREAHKRTERPTRQWASR